VTYPPYKCLRCGFWSFDTPVHGCTPRPFTPYNLSRSKSNG
jgi:hypothetical protein